MFYQRLNLKEGVYDHLVDIASKSKADIESQILQASNTSVGLQSYLDIKITNVDLVVCKEFGYFPEVIILTRQILDIVQNEEQVFWIISSLLSQPWVTPFIHKESIYRYNFHIFAITHIVKFQHTEILEHDSKDLETVILSAIQELVEMKEMAIYDILITVSEGDKGVGWMGWRV
jgi:hypothetical protein